VIEKLRSIKREEEFEEVLKDVDSGIAQLQRSKVLDLLQSALKVEEYAQWIEDVSKELRDLNDRNDLP